VFAFEKHSTPGAGYTGAVSLKCSFCVQHTHTHLTALFPGLPRWAGTRKVKPIWTDNHTSTPPLCFYRPDALPAAQPTASKHWRHIVCNTESIFLCVSTSEAQPPPATHYHFNHWSLHTHRGKWSQLTPPGKMDKKLKSENMQKRRAIRAGSCRERRYAHHVFIQI